MRPERAHAESLVSVPDLNRRVRGRADQVLASTTQLDVVHLIKPSQQFSKSNT